MAWRRLGARCASLIIGLLTAAQTAAQPQPGFVVPLGVNPGQTTEVTVFGAGQVGGPALWTSFPATAELSKPAEVDGKDSGSATYRVNVPAEAPPQVGVIRVYSPSGVSANVRAMLVDDLPTVMEGADNHAPATAQEVPFPSAVEGAADAEAMDYYKFAGKSGQRVSVEVYARRLGSPLDPVVRLLDAQGRELAYSDDEGGSGPDSRFGYQLPADGVYTLEVRDIRYQGGGNFRYRLRLGNFPLLTTPYPLAGRLNSTARLDWLGPQVAGAAPAETAIVAAPTQQVPLRLPGGAGAALTNLAASGRVESIEFEPNDAPEQAQPLSLPGGISGRFAAPRDKDWYQFEAKAGQRFQFSGQARNLGSPTDLLMRMHNAEGGLLVEADDAGTEEGVLDFTAPADGVYRLSVEDLNQRGGPEFGYRIAIEPYRPGFGLSVDKLGFTAPQGGVLAVDVQCPRRDYAGPVTLELRPSIEGLVYNQNVVPENADKFTLLATLPPGLAAGALHNCRIVGRATIGDAPFEAQASTLGALRASFDAWPYPPAEFDGQLAVGVGPVFPEFFKLSVEPTTVLFPQLVGTTTFKVKAGRMNGFEGAVALAAEGLPGEVTAEIKPIEEKAGEVELKLSGPAASAEGEYRFRLVGSGTHQSQPKQFVLEVPVRVVRPLGVTIEAPPVAPGATVKCKIKLARYGAESPDVAVGVRGLPPGLSLPAELKIPAGQSEAEFDLVAAADAPVGKVEGLIATASTKIAGRDLTVESTPVAVEIAAPAQPNPPATEEKTTEEKK